MIKMMNQNSLIIYFTLTKACNLACLHCIRSKIPNRVSLTETEVMPTDLAMESLDIISSFYSKSTLVITGGEPTLYSDFFVILKKACAQFERVVLTSNGLFTNDTLNKLVLFSNNKKNFYIQISLDGDEYTHDQIRGKGSFEKVFRRVKELCNLCRKNSISVSTTVNAINISSMFNLAFYLAKIPIQKWRLSPEQIFDKDLFVNRQISSLEWNRFVDAILPVCSFRVSIRKIFDFSLMDKLLDVSNGEYVKCNCGFGKSKIYIYPDFSVLLCTCMPHLTVGNVLNDDIELINERMLAYKLVCLDESVCKTCKYLLICNGGCVGYSFHYQGKIGLGDIRCPKVQQGKNIED